MCSAGPACARHPIKLADPHMLDTYAYGAHTIGAAVAHAFIIMLQVWLRMMPARGGTHYRGPSAQALGYRVVCRG